MSVYAYWMGCALVDVFKVASLTGTITFLSDVVADSGEIHICIYDVVTHSFVNAYNMDVLKKKNEDVTIFKNKTNHKTLIVFFSLTDFY